MWAVLPLPDAACQGSEDGSWPETPVKTSWKSHHGSAMGGQCLLCRPRAAGSPWPWEMWLFLRLSCAFSWHISWWGDFVSPLLSQMWDLSELVQRRSPGWFQGWSTSAVETEWGIWGCSAQRREGSREILLWTSSTWKEFIKEVERDFYRADNDSMRGNNFKLI